MDASRFNVVQYRRRVLALAAAGLLWAAPHAIAQGSDDQYDLTIRMEIPGMPMAMPPMSQRLCVRKGANDSDYIPQRENCRVSDAVRAGSRLTFKMTCTGTNAMSGTGDFVFSATGYDGQMRLRGKMDGQDMDMTQHIAARRSGGCTAPK
jgi:hypothetical protein